MIVGSLRWLHVEAVWLPMKWIISNVTILLYPTSLWFVSV